MKLGDVFYWETDQAAGYERRHKYHVYICEGNWRHQGYVFLFINKSNAIQGYRITKPPYGFLKYPESYVSCNSIALYEEVSPRLIGECVGTLDRRHLQELREEIAKSDVMEQDIAALICEVIDRRR